MQDFSSEFEFAKQLILLANTIATTKFFDNPTIKEKADKSYVTETDEALETFFTTKLREKFPQYGFIGEEGTYDTKEYNWIIDPIDGTTAFARGLPEFGIVLAFVSQTNVLFAFIYRPILNELFSAKKGQGAFKNDQKITVSDVSELSHAVISFTPQCFSVEKYREYSLNLCQTNHLRVAHSSAVESTLLAQGNIDVLIKFDQPIWDTAAQYLLMTEAGATVADKYGNPLQLSFEKGALHDYIASTPALAINEVETLYFK